MTAPSRNRNLNRRRIRRSPQPGRSNSKRSLPSRAASLHGRRELPAFCRVDQDADIWPHGLSDRLDAACLSLWARFMAQAHFDGRIPVRYVATGGFC